MHTFTNLQAFGDWAIRLVVTLAAMAGVLDRTGKRLFKRYFDQSITDFNDKLTIIEKEIKTHEHAPIPKKGWFNVH